MLIIFSLLYLVPVWSCRSYPATPTFFSYCVFQPIPWRIEIFFIIRLRALLPYCVWDIYCQFHLLSSFWSSLLSQTMFSITWVYSSVLHVHVHVLLRLVLFFLRGCFLKTCTSFAAILLGYIYIHLLVSHLIKR